MFDTVLTKKNSKAIFYRYSLKEIDELPNFVTTKFLLQLLVQDSHYYCML